MYRLFVHDLSGQSLGELRGVSDLKIGAGLSRMATLSCRVGLDDDLADVLQDRTARRVIVAHRLNPRAGTAATGLARWPITFAGLVLTAEESLDEKDEYSLAIVCADPYTQLQTRIADDDAGAGRSPAGLTLSGEPGQIAALLIDNTNRLAGPTLIRADQASQAVDPSGAGLVSVTRAGAYQKISALIEQLATGMEWRLRPTLTHDAHGDLVLGEFVSAPILGADKTTSLWWEMGAGEHNVTSYRLTTDMSQIVTKATNAVSGRAQYEISFSDKVAARQWGASEEMVSADGITDAELIRRLCSYTVGVRQAPRRMVEITPGRSDLTGLPDVTATPMPDGTAPPTEGAWIPLVDYEPGDQMTVRIVYRGRTRVMGTMRVYDIDVSVDAEGHETATLALYD